MNNKKGFTLIELLAVIAILAILILIAMPNILKRFNEAKKNIFIDEVKTAYEEATSAYIENSLSGTAKTILSSENNDLKLDGEELKYCIKTNTKGEVEYMKIGNGSYYTIYDGEKTIDKYNSSDALDYDSSITFECEEDTVIITNVPERCKKYNKDNDGDYFDDGLYTYYYGKTKGGYSLGGDGWVAYFKNKDVVTINKEDKPCEMIGDKPLISLESTFAYLSKLEKIDLSDFNSTNIISLKLTFSNLSSESKKTEIIGLNNWNIKNVENMSYTFDESEYITYLDLNKWDTSNVLSMSYMFYKTGYKAKTFKLDISNWNTSNVKNMSWMFYEAGSNATTWNIGDLSTKNVSLDGKNYIAWDVSNVGNMTRMFRFAGQHASKFDIGNIGNWNTSSVTSMYEMLCGAGYNATIWNIGDLSTKNVSLDGKNYIAWDVSNVSIMSYMFDRAGYNASKFDIGNIGNWNTSSVTGMAYMFDSAGSNATTWNIGDLSTKNVSLDGKNYIAWDVSNVSNMSDMFSCAGGNVSVFNIGNIGNWNTSSVTDMSYMFDRAGNKATTWYIGDLSTKKVTGIGPEYIAWDVSNVTGGSYTERSCDAADCGSSGQMKSFWGMFENAAFNATEFNIGNIGNWNTSNAKVFNEMFHGAGYNAKNWYIGDLSAKKITDIGSKYIAWDVSNSISFNAMFRDAAYKATKFNIGNIGNWNVSNSLYFDYMFAYAGQKATTWYIGDISTKNVSLDGKNYIAWNMSKAQNLSYMFLFNDKNNIDIGNISNWDTSNVIRFTRMFENVKFKSQLDLSGWKTNNARFYTNFNKNSNVISPFE